MDWIEDARIIPPGEHGNGVEVHPPPFIQKIDCRFVDGVLQMEIGNHFLHPGASGSESIYVHIRLK